MSTSASPHDDQTADAPSATSWVAAQVELYERTDGQQGGTFRGYPIIVVTMTGARSGLIRKVPLMRVHRAGTYAVVAANGGDPEHPAWYRNVIASDSVRVQDRHVVTLMRPREIHGVERGAWWSHAVATYPPYEAYQADTSRLIPVVLLEPICADEVWAGPPSTRASWS